MPKIRIFLVKFFELNMGCGGDSVEMQLRTLNGSHCFCARENFEMPGDPEA